MVATLALGHPIFHYDGDFDARLAVRNLYLEERDLGLEGLSLWMGSRMLRGDDIYLLDFWPLDNLNTVGGGVRYDVCGSHDEPAPEDQATGEGEAHGERPQVSELPPPWCTGVQLHGGLGVSRELGIEYVARMVRIWRILEGPSEIHRWLVARQILRSKKPYNPFIMAREG